MAAGAAAAEGVVTLRLPFCAGAAATAGLPFFCGGAPALCWPFFCWPFSW